MAFIEVEMYESHCTKGGMRFVVEHDGEILVESARDPEHEAARALRALGESDNDTMAIKWRGSKHFSRFAKIGWLADNATTEGQNSGPRTIQYVPYTGPVKEDE